MPASHVNPSRLNNTWLWIKSKGSIQVKNLSSQSPVLPGSGKILAPHSVLSLAGGLRLSVPWQCGTWVWNVRSFTCFGGCSWRNRLLWNNHGTHCKRLWSSMPEQHLWRIEGVQILVYNLFRKYFIMITKSLPNSSVHNIDIYGDGRICSCYVMATGFSFNYNFDLYVLMPNDFCTWNKEPF